MEIKTQRGKKGVENSDDGEISLPCHSAFSASTLSFFFRSMITKKKKMIPTLDDDELRVEMEHMVAL